MLPTSRMPKLSQEADLYRESYGKNPDSQLRYPEFWIKSPQVEDRFYRQRLAKMSAQNYENNSPKIPNISWERVFPLPQVQDT